MRRLQMRFAVGLLIVMGTLASLESAQADYIVLEGYDLFQSTRKTTFGGVNFQGVPLGSFDFGSGPEKTWSTDTIMQRKQAADTGGSPGTAPPIDIEFVALQLRSVAPVDFG